MQPGADNISNLTSFILNIVSEYPIFLCYLSPICYCLNKMKFFSKQITVTLILASFLTLALFGLTFMMHGPDGRMPGDCPFSAMSQSICPQEATLFFNTSTTKAPLTAWLIFSFLPLFSLLSATYFLINFSLFNLPNRKTIRWLALHENSPNIFSRF